MYCYGVTVFLSFMCFILTCLIKHVTNNTMNFQGFVQRRKLKSSMYTGKRLCRQVTYFRMSLLASDLENQSVHACEG